MMPDKKDNQSVQYAHWRIDQLEKDISKMSKSIKQIADSSEKTSRHNMAIKWILVGGLGFYIIESIGLIGFLKII